MKEINNSELLEIYKLLKDYLKELKGKLEESKNDGSNQSWYRKY